MLPQYWLKSLLVLQRQRLLPRKRKNTPQRRCAAVAFKAPNKGII